MDIGGTLVMLSRLTATGRTGPGKANGPVNAEMAGCCGKAPKATRIGFSAKNATLRRPALVRFIPSDERSFAGWPV